MPLHLQNTFCCCQGLGGCFRYGNRGGCRTVMAKRWRWGKHLGCPGQWKESGPHGSRETHYQARVSPSWAAPDVHRHSWFLAHGQPGLPCTCGEVTWFRWPTPALSGPRGWVTKWSKSEDLWGSLETHLVSFPPHAQLWLVIRNRTGISYFIIYF